MGCSCLSKSPKLQKPLMQSLVHVHVEPEPFASSVFAIHNRNQLIEYSLLSEHVESTQLSVEMLSEAGFTCIGQNVMLAGGIELSYEEVATCYLIKTKEAEVQRLPSLPLPRRRLKLCYDGRDNAFAVGGVRESLNKHSKGINIDYSKCFTKFSFSSNSWTELPDLAIPVECPAVCYYLDQVYAFGGYNGDICIDSVQHFSFLSDTWIIAEICLPDPLQSLMAVALTDQVLVFGGLDDDDNPNYHSYTYSKNKFKKSGNLPSNVSPVFINYALPNENRVWSFNEELAMLCWSEGQWSVKLLI